MIALIKTELDLNDTASGCRNNMMQVNAHWQQVLQKSSNAPVLTALRWTECLSPERLAGRLARSGRKKRLICEGS
jgi:hypothetical protein